MRPQMASRPPTALARSTRVDAKLGNAQFTSKAPPAVVAQQEARRAELAAQVNRLLPQYTIKRTATAEEKGIEAAPRVRESRYMLRCVRCGREFRRERQSRIIQHPERYRCTCGGTLERVR